MAAARTGGYLPLAVAVAFVSSGSILVRFASAPALAVAFQRIFLASLLLFPFAIAGLRRAWPSLPRGRRLALLGCGVALALHFATWIASLSFTTVAASVLLVNTAPLFSIGFSFVLLNERVSRRVAIATALALAGAIVIALGDWRSGAQSLFGDVLALVGAATLSLYHVAGRGLREALPLQAYVLAVWSTAAIAIALLAMAFGVRLFDYGPRTWAAFGALAVFPTLLGHGLVNLSLRALPAPTVGLFLLGEPLAASALAYGILGEAPASTTFAGGALVLAALAIVAASGR
jgi:drug/metabolite transporter (DMT)-like permease